MPDTPRKSHILRLAVVKDGPTPKGMRYMGVRYCEDCMVAEPALGLFYSVPGQAKVFPRGQLKIITGGLPVVCSVTIKPSSD